jgi:hypothetical protein
MSPKNNNPFQNVGGKFKSSDKLLNNKLLLKAQKFPYLKTI